MIRGLNPTRRQEEAASRVSKSSQPAWAGSACANARGGAVTAGSGSGSGRQYAGSAGVRGVQNSTAVSCGSGAHAASRTAAQLMGRASTCTAAQRVFAVRDTSRKRRDAMRACLTRQDVPEKKIPLLTDSALLRRAARRHSSQDAGNVAGSERTRVALAPGFRLFPEKRPHRSPGGAPLTRRLPGWLLSGVFPGKAGTLIVHSLTLPFQLHPRCCARLPSKLGDYGHPVVRRRREQTTWHRWLIYLQTCWLPSSPG